MLSEYGEALGHEAASDWVIDLAPTCTTVGKKTLHCIRCDIVMRTSQIPKDNTAHDYSTEWTTDKEATCTEAGSKSRHCNICGEKTDVTEISATGSHDYVLVSQETSHPHTKAYICSVCGEEKSESTALPDCLACNFSITAIDVSSYKLTAYIGTSANVVVPSTYNNCRVTTIANGCFKGNTELYGTGTEISVFDGDDYKGDYKVIVIGDLNGDSVCDVVDAAEAERVSSGQATATTEQVYAANGCISDELDVASYQTFVNNVLAN